MPLTFTDPLAMEGWDALVESHPRGSFFHTRAWARVLNAAYGFTPCYLTEITNGKLQTLLPIMETQSPITGRNGVMLPFADFCPLISNRDHFLDSPAFDQLLSFGRRRRWKHVEFRGGERFFQSQPSCASYFTHTLVLDRQPEGLSRLRGSTRRNIRKAETSGIEIVFQQTLDAVHTYYGLHCRTRKTHGVPPQPKHFFTNLHEHAIARDKGFVALAHHRGRVIAGAVFLYANQSAIFKYGASDPAHLHLRPNNLIMWRAIEHFANRGYRRFSFGRTEKANTGLLQFKRGWRPLERTLDYYCCNVRDGRFLPPRQHYLNTFKPLFRRLPLPVLRSIGELVYCHIG